MISVIRGNLEGWLLTLQTEKIILSENTFRNNTKQFPSQLVQRFTKTSALSVLAKKQKKKQVWGRQRHLFLNQKHLLRLISQFTLTDRENYIKSCCIPALASVQQSNSWYQLDFVWLLLFSLSRILLWTSAALLHTHIVAKCSGCSRAADIPPLSRHISGVGESWQQEDGSPGPPDATRPSWEPFDVCC